ncbi:GNAT family N-acetyltransferase [Streptomyces sp. NPDC006879]|uniref:GNAT family N-acetyltransferase n=1 Tax=Streptomyces sp. NPDC006879 TaxID=3364767 RepID=UPI00369CB995
MNHSPATAPGSGAPREPVHVRHIEDFGTIRVTPVDPAVDSPLLHSWVREDRAAFWGMRELTQEVVREIYEDLDRRTTHHAFLVHRDGEPVALFQTYQPEEDRISECYPVRKGDLGVHLMLGPVSGRPRPGFSRTLVSALMTFAFSDGASRLVAEPDAANEKAISLLRRIGFEVQGEIELPEVDLPEVYLPAKTAVLGFLDRSRVMAAP